MFNPSARTLISCIGFAALALQGCADGSSALDVADTSEISQEILVGQADVELVSYEVGTDTCGVTACSSVSRRWCRSRAMST